MAATRSLRMVWPFCIAFPRVPHLHAFCYAAPHVVDMLCCPWLSALDQCSFGNGLAARAFHASILCVKLCAWLATWHCKVCLLHVVVMHVVAPAQHVGHMLCCPSMSDSDHRSLIISLQPVSAPKYGWPLSCPVLCMVW